MYFCPTSRHVTYFNTILYNSEILERGNQPQWWKFPMFPPSILNITPCYNITVSPQNDITTVLTCTSTASRSVPSFLDTRAFTKDLGTERVLDSKWWTGGSLGSLPPDPAEMGVCVSTRPITSQERRTLSSSRRRETEVRVSVDRG